MKVTIEHHSGQYPSFNINLHNVEGAEPFLTIKGCRIVDGQNGPFISYPSRKMDNGKYWNHVYGGEKFNAHVLELAQGGQQERRPPPTRTAPPKSAGGGSRHDDDSSIPF